MNRYFLSGTLIGGLILLGWTGGAGAQTTAKSGTADADNPTFYKALHVLGDSLGRNAMENVVEASGRGGDPQPVTWKIVLKEGTGSREVDVSNGKITAQRPLERPAPGGVVKLAELNLDSSGAFDATDVQARKVKLRYDSLNYLLRVSPSGKPVWSIDLLNQEGDKIGAIRLAAHDGTTIGTEGRLANNSNPPPPTTTVPTTPPVVTRETPRPTRRPVVTETRERTTSTYTTTTTSRGGPVATPPPPPSTYTATTTRDIPVATLSDREDGGTTTTTTTTEVSRGEGGLFTRTGRTLDRTSRTVESSLRNAGSKVQRFFTFSRRDSNDDDGQEIRDTRDNRVENPRD